MDECEPLKLGNPTAVAFALITASQFHLPYYMVWPSRFDPIEPTLKPPGTKRLKVKCDEPLSKLAFKFNLRRYNVSRTLPNTFALVLTTLGVADWLVGLSGTLHHCPDCLLIVYHPTCTAAPRRGPITTALTVCSQCTTQREQPSTCWVGDFHIWGPGIRPNPSESDSLPNPSESGTHFCRDEMPIQTVQYRKKYPCGAARNPPESVRIRPSTESVRIPNRHPSRRVATAFLE